MEDTTISDTQSPGIFILLPVLNEVENIGPLVDRIDQVLEGHSYTVGIVDDGSTDGTLAHLEERMNSGNHHLHLIRRKKKGRGSQRGSALHLLLLWGLHHTDHQVFVEMDGDLSHRPEELREGIRWVAGSRSDIAVASKYVEGSQVLNRPLGRRLVSRICSAAVGTLISRQLRDYSNGYRFYTRAAARLVSEHRIRYGSPIYLTEVMALWLRKGLQVVEFPTTYVGRNEGLSKLRFLDLIKAVVIIFEIAVRFHLTSFQPSKQQTPLAITPSVKEESVVQGKQM